MKRLKVGNMWEFEKVVIFYVLSRYIVCVCVNAGAK